jgi:hypothetical protein
MNKNISHHGIIYPKMAGLAIEKNDIFFMSLALDAELDAIFIPAKWTVSRNIEFFGKKCLL